MTSPLPEALLTPILLRALEEDLGHGGDLSTLATVDPDARATASLNPRASGTAAGVAMAAQVFRLVDPRVAVVHAIGDGETFDPSTPLLTVEGPARALLTAERTALNLLSHLTGIASLTADYVRRVEGTAARIAATRKTLPGLRLLQKHAVRMGGGMTHRMSLSDAVMIKDNHIAASGGIADAIARARKVAGHTVKIEVEVDRMDQLEEALGAAPDIILLDNMPPDILRQAVALNGGRCVLEASGGVGLDTIRTIAETGVDVISVGALTHSAPSLDIGMELSPLR